jgi:thiosulfate/3-mercaptopyruvate sulfurtransferase
VSIAKNDSRPFGKGRLNWVSTRWLAEHLKDVKIIDAQPDFHDYMTEHIAGAVYLNENTMKAWSGNLPQQYLSPEYFCEIMGRSGISTLDPTVVYSGKGGSKGQGDSIEQAVVAYALLRFAHNHVYILDGGLDKWKSEHRPVTRELPQVIPSRYASYVDGSTLINLDELIKVKDSSDTLLLDARKPAFYTGEDGLWARNGHIPGAVNLHWSTLMNANNSAELKPIREIATLVEKVGATKDKMIVCYCGSGRAAALEYEILKHLLGYERVRLYEKSFIEWSANPKLPVAKGQSPG